MLALALNRQIQGLHFCGNAMKNCPQEVGEQLANQFRGQGDFLIFEESGQALFFSQVQL